MPVRLTPKTSFLISYDRESDSWVSIDGVDLSLLPHYVEIEPGVTIENIFCLIDRDPALKRFLSAYCSCDIDAIRESQNSSPKRLEVFTEVAEDNSGQLVLGGSAPADTIVVTSHYCAFTDAHTGARRLEGGHVLMAKSSRHDVCSISLPSPPKLTYREIREFFVVLDNEMWIEECDPDKCTGPDTFAFSADIRRTLFDVLTTIVGHFGVPAFDPRYQKEIDDEAEFWERIRRRFKGPDGDATK